MTVNSWLKANRQWGRALNIAHARHQHRIAVDAGERQFWSLVLDKLEH